MYMVPVRTSTRRAESVRKEGAGRDAAAAAADAAPREGGGARQGGRAERRRGGRQQLDGKLAPATGEPHRTAPNRG